MGKADGKLVLSKMQSDCMITKVQHNRMCGQKIPPKLMGLVIGGT